MATSNQRQREEIWANHIRTGKSLLSRSGPIAEKRDQSQYILLLAKETWIWNLFTALCKVL